MTQEDYQEFVLSQIKRIIWGTSPGNWYLDFASIGILSLKQLSEVIGGRVYGVGLLGVRNGVNLIFTSPDKFVNVAGGETIRVLYNGQRLLEIDDYTLSESGGVGTGYDTVTTLVAPRSSDKLTADYTKV